MAEYLRDHDIPADRIVIEDRSRTTEENLAFTATLLTDQDQVAPPRRFRRFLPVRSDAGVTVVTSNYHGFRAATLMRRLDLPGQVTGAPTARYYWPSATIREYVALLRDHWVINLIFLVISLIPLLVSAIGAIA
jgi:uncharacterized SAM-binding protein YcdF (DUF218 family)